jgi:hypothetical protein
MRFLAFLGTEYVAFVEDGVLNFLSAEMAVFHVGLVGGFHFVSPFYFDSILAVPLCHECRSNPL